MEESSQENATVASWSPRSILENNSILMFKILILLVEISVNRVPELFIFLI